MIHRPEHVMHWHVIVWTTLFVLGFMMSAGLLFAPRRRQIRKPAPIETQVETQEKATQTTTTPEETKVTQATSAVQTQEAPKVSTREERFNTIKSLLAQDDPQIIDTGVVELKKILRDFMPELQSLPYEEYKEYYKQIETAVQKTDTSDLAKMTNLYYLTKWAYRYFPYEEGFWWWSGNKNDIEDLHQGTCKNLQELARTETEKKLYEFVEVPVEDRIKYEKPEPQQVSGYTWPELPKLTSNLQEKSDYRLIEEYLEGVEKNLHKIRPTADRLSFNAAMNSILRAISLVQTCPESNRYRQKSVMRLLDSIQSSFFFSTTQTSVLDALADNRSALPEQSHTEAISWLNGLKTKKLFKEKDLDDTIQEIKNAQMKKFPK